MINDIVQQKAMEAADEFYKPHDRGQNPSGIDYEIIDSIEDKKEGFKKGFLAGYSLANERIKELEDALQRADDLFKVMDIPKNKPAEENYQYRTYMGRLYDYNKAKSALFIESKNKKS